MPPTTSAPRYSVVGAGILGIAVAQSLLRRGVRHVTLFEAGPHPASAQTLRNSGVLHAGLYYKPSSLKATLCRQGHRQVIQYCDTHNIPYNSCGKLVLALHQHDLPRLNQLYNNALLNSVPDVAYLPSARAVQRVEPLAAGIAAVYSPHTAVINWSHFALHLLARARHKGLTLFTDARVVGFLPSSQTSSTSLVLQIARPNSSLLLHPTDRVIVCAGVEADRVAQTLGGSPTPVILPIRGEYLTVDAPAHLKPSVNIYPLPPEPSTNPHRPSPPFLGVHFTPTLSPDNDVIVGPNAVPAFSRTGHTWTDINRRDLQHILTAPGFWPFLRHNLPFALSQIHRSLYLPSAIREARRLVPSLLPHHFRRRSPRFHGIRAQALSPDGSLIDDFVFESVAHGRILHVRNAPSPGATSALAIAEHVVQRSFHSLNS